MYVCMYMYVYTFTNNYAFIKYKKDCIYDKR